MLLVSPYDIQNTASFKAARSNMENCDLALKSIINFNSRGEESCLKFFGYVLFSVSEKHIEGSNKAKKIPVESADSYKSHTAGRSQMTVEGHGGNWPVYWIAMKWMGDNKGGTWLHKSNMHAQK